MLDRNLDLLIIACIATRHLIENGCRNIAFIGGSASTSLERMAGYRETLRDTGLAVPESYALCSGHADDMADQTGINPCKRC